MRQRLGVNVDHVATLRQARGSNYPDPVAAAMIAELAGAGQITVHLREDRRHIQERDLRLLRQTVQTLLNLEMAATEAMLDLALECRPDLVTLVPERRAELTTEGGLDVAGQLPQLTSYVKRLQSASVPVSLFIDPSAAQVEAAQATTAKRVELHTGRYCEARNEADRARELARIQEAAKLAVSLGMGCAAGHGLHYENVQPIVLIEEIDELNIGHSIVSQAVMVGFEKAVRDMLDRMQRR